MKTVLCSVVFGVAALLTVCGGKAQDQHPGPGRGTGMTALPVLTATQQVGPRISACMYPGARPSTYDVVSHSCRGGASVCTAWVLMRSAEEMEMLTIGFDLTNPPVEATGPTCERPELPTSG